MSKIEVGKCEQCSHLHHFPMYMITPGSNNKSNADDRIIVAARIKCTCMDDMVPDHEINAADLSNLKPEIRQLIYNRIKAHDKSIPIIDPERINECDCVMFITGFSKTVFNSWMSLDLLTVEQLYSHIQDKNITVEEIRI
jgi:hypothetical protein